VVGDVVVLVLEFNRIILNSDICCFNLINSLEMHLHRESFRYATCKVHIEILFSNLDFSDFSQ